MKLLRPARCADCTASARLWKSSPWLRAMKALRACWKAGSPPYSQPTTPPVTADRTMFNVVSTGLSVYRNKTTIGNFASAGALTGAIFRMHLGLQGLAGGFVFGTAFGIPAGGLLIVMQKLTGETLQEKRNRERRELYEQKLVEWQSRLSVTEVLGQMESDAQGEPETESKRI